MRRIEGRPPGLKDSQYYEYATWGIDIDGDGIPDFPAKGGRGLERYLPLLPIEALGVSLAGAEGGTPVGRLTKLGGKYGFNNLWAKHEDHNPTGSFKDRESAVVLSAAVEKGVKKVVIISSGNAAVSTAAYSQKAGIECVCYVPEKTTPEKKALIGLFGARLIQIPGFYEDVYRKVVDENPEGWNVTAGQNELRTEGDKTIAFEIWEQLGVPDKILVPCGNGGCLAGIWKGFIELKQLGLIEKLPQMIAVQVKDASPFKVALEKHLDFAVLGEIGDSVAEGIVAQESYCSPKAVKALRDSGGGVIEVDEGEIKQGLKEAIEIESIVPEPTSATVYAALRKLKADPDEMIVLINTASGMKLLHEIMAII